MMFGLGFSVKCSGLNSPALSKTSFSVNPDHPVSEEYSSKYKVKNLWKYDLPKGWRLIYSIANSEIVVVSLILEWFDHKEYERKFKY